MILSTSCRFLVSFVRPEVLNCTLLKKLCKQKYLEQNITVMLEPPAQPQTTNYMTLNLSEDGTSFHFQGQKI